MIIFAAGLMAATLSATDGSATTTPAPAPVTTPAPAGAATTLATQDPNEVVICHRVSTTGSRLDFTKVCKTRREWNVTSRNSQDVLDAAQRRSLAYGPKGS